MSDKQYPNGGPAFPTADDDCYWHGMSLREWFAGQALVGLAQTNMSIMGTAQTAWDLADAMLKAGEQNKEETKP